MSSSSREPRTARYSARCLESVLNQDYSNWIQVVINNGGSRGTVDAVINKYEDGYSGRIILINNETSVGMEAASNIGIRATQSRFVVILDDDDTWDPKFLSKMVAALEQPEFPDVRGVVSIPKLFMSGSMEIR